MIPIFPREAPDDSGITLLSSDLPSAVQDRVHRHDCYEMALVVRGSCELQIPAARTPLIAGDLFLTRPGEPHIFRLQKNAALLYCQFGREVAPAAREALQRALQEIERTGARAAHKRVRELMAFEQATDTRILLQPGSMNLEGLLHLGHAQAEEIYTLLDRIGQEQNTRGAGFEQMKRLYLEQALILLSRAQTAAPRTGTDASWKHELIGTVLDQIDADLAQNINFEEIAERNGMTLSYFRTVFKRMTGLPPTDYLNRMRILRALELLQTTDLTIAETAMQVGIYDANYFSRLFKKIIGYPPRYFKAIDAPADDPFSE